MCSATARRRRKKTLAHFVARRACRMSAHIEPGDRLTGAVDDRHRDRAQAAFELFVDDGKSLRVVFAHPLVERLHVGDRRRRVGLDAQ